MNNVILSHLLVCPLTSLDIKSMAEGNRLDYYNGRTQYVLDSDYTHISALMSAYNSAYAKPDQKVSKQYFVASVINTVTDTVIASKEFTITLSPWEESERVWIDIKVNPSKLEAGTEYMVRVQHKGETTEGPFSTLSFIDPYIDFTKILKVSKAFIDHNDVRYRTLNVLSSNDAAVFQFDCDPDLVNRLPEIELCVHYNDKVVASKIEYLSYSFFGHKLVSRIDLNKFGKITTGLVYAQVRIVGIPLAGMILYPGADPDEFGEFDPDELAPVTPTTDILLDKRRNINETPARALKGSIDKLNALVGLDSIKDKIAGYTQLVRFNQRRQSLGLPTSTPPLHALFLGSPGTGKTTVAKLMGQLLHGAGVLSKGHVVMRERSTLIGQYYSSEGEKTLEALQEAQGGILFIDEAYQLFQPHDPKDPGRFVLETLMTALADESSRDWMLILAGYTEPTLRMLTLNPGLSSRIPESNHYIFEDFTAAQLSEIAFSYLRHNHYELTPEAEAQLTSVLNTDYANRPANFGNARHVLNVIQNGVFPAMARRLFSITEPDERQLSLVLPCDIPAPMPNWGKSRQRVGFAAR